MSKKKFRASQRPKRSPIAVAPSRPEDIDLADIDLKEWAEQFQFLVDEWKGADSYLDEQGFPAHPEVEGEMVFMSLQERISALVNAERSE